MVSTIDRQICLCSRQTGITVSLITYPKGMLFIQMNIKTIPSFFFFEKLRFEFSDLILPLRQDNQTEKVRNNFIFGGVESIDRKQVLLRLILHRIIEK